MNIQKLRLENQIIIIAFFVILAAALVLRLAVLRGQILAFDAQAVVQDDYYRDYLVSHHIAAYQEYPLLGPAGFLARHINSPAYFYLLAAPLFIKDTFITLGIFNIVLQLLTLVFVFLLARYLFGNRVAIVAASLFGFHLSVLGQSLWIWQPNAMQPFLVLSYLLLAVGWRKKSFSYLISSIPVFFFSLALHPSVLAMAPPYLFFLLAGVRNIGGTAKHYAAAIMACVGAFGLFFAPLFFYAGTAGVTDFIRYIDKNLVANLYSRFSEFLHYFLLTDMHSFWPAVAFVDALLVLFLYYFFYSERPGYEKKVSVLLLASIVWFMLVGSLLSQGMYWYFVPVFSIAAIVVAEVINSAQNWAFKTVLVAAALYFIAPSPSAFLWGISREVIASYDRPISSLYQPPPFVAAIKNEVMEIKETQGRADHNFFTLLFYAKGEGSEYAPVGYEQDRFWTTMEIELRTKLTAVDDAAYRSYRPIATKEYLFLGCGDAVDVTPCLDAFLGDFPKYKPQKQFRAEPYQVYLTKRD